MSKLPPGFTREDEYEDQFYGFCSHDVSSKFREIITNQILEQFASLRKEVLQKSDEDKREALNHAFEALIVKFTENSRLPLGKLEERVPNFFALPASILLPEDEVQRERYSQEDLIRQKETLSQLKSKYRRAKCLKAVFNEELKRVERSEKHLKLFQDISNDILSLKDFETRSEKSFKAYHKLTQNIIGLEVKEASLKISDKPSCAENDEILMDAVIQPYTS